MKFVIESCINGWIVKTWDKGREETRVFSFCDPENVFELAKEHFMTSMAAKWTDLLEHLTTAQNLYLVECQPFSAPPDDFRFFRFHATYLNRAQKDLRQQLIENDRDFDGLDGSFGPSQPM